jgi:hypothetical protein
VSAHLDVEIAFEGVFKREDKANLRPTQLVTQRVTNFLFWESLCKPKTLFDTIYEQIFLFTNLRERRRGIRSAGCPMSLRSVGNLLRMAALPPFIF